jgi:hippurate hydrolase
MSLDQKDRDALIALRRDLHRHPELSWKESRTQERLERALREFGIADIRRVAKTGLVARIRGSGDGATVAVRGDIDALPITEATGLDFASQNPGVMHACGHDVHASWAVGAARSLVQSPAAGDVLVVLQPAEEVGQGAAELLKSGALDDARVIFGGHVDRRFDVGTVVAQSGPLAASADSFTINVRGVGSHGARPHLAKDPIVAASALILDLQRAFPRTLDPADPVVLTVGAIHGGDAPNVIPATVELRGTFRTTTAATRIRVREELGRRCAAVGEAHGIEVLLVSNADTPPLENSADAADWAAEAARDVLGPNGVVPLGFTNMASEDFAFYLERIPGCFLRIGAREPGGVAADVHTPTFVPAEEALFVGATVLAESARVASRAITNRQAPRA